MRRTDDDRVPGMAQRTRSLRWAVALLLVAAAGLLVATGALTVCEEVAAASGATTETCRPPRADDGVTLALGVLLLVLLAPDLSEIGVPGVVSLRSRLGVAEERLEAETEERHALAARVDAVQAQLVATSAQAHAGGAVVTVISGDDTARFAGGSGGGATSSDRSGDPVVDQARYLAAELLMSHLDDTGSGSLLGASLRLYLPVVEEAGLMLAPVLHRSQGDVTGAGWKPGQGAVGRAWHDDAIVVARGDEVHLGLDDLPEERRSRYTDLALVVAMPVRNASLRPVAVLSATSTDPGSGLDRPESVSDLSAAADMIARVLVDLLGWARDQPDETAGNVGAPLRAGRGHLWEGDGQ